MSHDKKKLVTNIRVKAVTTAEVVDSPTPLAPPEVVNPQLQPIIATIEPKMTDLICAAIRSHTCKKFKITICPRRKTASKGR